MSLSIRHSLKYPFQYPTTRIRFIILLVLAIIPFGETFFLSPFTTAAVSALTIERREDVVLGSGILISRALRALVAGWLTLIYFVPGLIGISMGAYRYFHQQSITWPLVALGVYGLLVLSVLPLATLHAVSTQNVLNALHLPKLLWISLKVDLITTLKVVIGSMLLLALKVGVSFLSLFGLGILLSPFKAYSEYVFQYFLAASYVAAYKN